MSVLDRVQADGRVGAADRLLADAAGATEAARGLAAAAAGEMVSDMSRRLDEEARLGLARLLAGLVLAVEDDLRQRLLERLGEGAPPELATALAATDIALAAPVLDRARLLGDPALAAVLLRRVEEERLTAALRPAALAPPTLLDDLLQSGDEVMASMVMALIVTESRGRASISRVGLPADLQHRLTWWVAASLRHYILARGLLPALAADRALAAAANASLAGYDEGDTAEACAMQLARRLHQRGRLDDALLVRALEEGWLLLAVAGLAVRAGIGFVAAWAMTADPAASRLTVLLRAAGLGRTPAATFVRTIGAAGGTDPRDLAEWIEAFDWLDPAAAREAISPWTCDSALADAVADLAGGLSRDARR